MNTLNINQIRNMWMLEPKSRMSCWRDFRLELQTTYNISTLLDTMSKIETWWNSAPIVSISIDPYTSDTWPTVWEILCSGECCKYSKALSMAYNMYYVDKNLDIQLYHIVDNIANDVYMIAVVNNQFVFNYAADNVVLLSEILENISINEKWDIADLIK